MARTDCLFLAVVLAAMPMRSWASEINGTLLASGEGGQAGASEDCCSGPDALPTLAEPFDCDAGVSNWRHGWSAAKKEWCCQNKRVGCSFDCDAGKSNLENGWSSAKKEWCCTANGVGCASTEAQRYVFVGYGDALNAREACRNYKGLPMPKTESEQSELQATVDKAVVAGNLSQTWPNNTIWLGARWEEERSRWEWDDNTRVGVHRAAAASLNGLGASSRHEQAMEPWLCQMLDGMWHDSLPIHKFGIFCELSVNQSRLPVPGDTSSSSTPSTLTTTSTLTVTRTVTTSTTVTTRTTTATTTKTKTLSSTTTKIVTTSLTLTRSSSSTTSLTKTTTVSTSTTLTTTPITTLITTTTGSLTSAEAVATPGWLWLEFDPTKLRGGQAVDFAQLSEVWFRGNGSTIDFASAEASNPGGMSPAGQGPSKAIDQDDNTKWLDYYKGPLRIKLPHFTPVDAFGLTTANDETDRDPIQWTLKGSRDGEAWTILHKQDTDYNTPLMRRVATPAIPFNQVRGFDTTTTTEVAAVADEVAPPDHDDGSMSIQEKVIGGAVGGSVGAVAVGLLGGLLGGLLSTAPPNTTMPNSWPPKPTTTTAAAPRTSLIEVTFVSGPTTIPVRFLEDSQPTSSLGGAVSHHLGSIQPWWWATLAAAALSVAVCMLVGFQFKGRSTGGRGTKTRHANLEDSPSSAAETDEESCASSSLIDNEMSAPQAASQPDAFDLIDQNHDGVITRAEFEAARRFELMDQNHDGVISRAEFEAAAQMQTGHVASAYVPVGSTPVPIMPYYMQASMPVTTVQMPVQMPMQMPVGVFAPVPVAPPLPPVPFAPASPPGASVMVISSPRF